MSDVKIIISREVAHFPVPNGVYIVMPAVCGGSGFNGNQTLPLGELDEQTLDLLCRTFRDEVFAEAAKQKRNKTTTLIRGGGGGR